MYSIKVDASVNTIPIIFDESAGSKVGIDLPANSRIQIISCASETVAVVVANYQSAPSTSVTNQIYCVGNGTTTLDEIHISNKATLYIRSDGAEITSGKIYIHMGGRR